MANRTFTVYLGDRASFSSVSSRRRSSFTVSAGVFFTASPYGDTSFSRLETSPKASYPGARVPIGYVNGDRSKPIYLDPSWERWLRHTWFDRLGGDSGPTMTEVQTNVVETKAQAVEAAATATAVEVQVIANAESLAATVEVAQNNSLAGATSIPPVVRRPYSISMDP